MDFDLSGFQTVHLNKKNGSILREKRVVLGLTQKEVAEREDYPTPVSEIRKR